MTKQTWEEELKELFNNVDDDGNLNTDFAEFISFISNQISLAITEERQRIKDLCLINSHKVKEGKFIWLKDILNFINKL